MIKEEITDDLMDRENVFGVGRHPVKNDVLIVFVSEKKPEGMLDDKDVVPPTIEIDGEWYDTEVRGVGEAYALRKEKHRPAPAGVSTGHGEITAGTLGSVPLETQEGLEVFLTNAHVAAPPQKVEPADDIIQPGRADGGKPDKGKIGEVVDWSDIDKDGKNGSDSALVHSDKLKDNELFDLGVLHGLSTAYSKGTEFEKSGRTTGVTTGALVADDVTVNVRGYYPGESVTFTEVDGFEPMSSGGDSGSLICERRKDKRAATHLLFAGSPQVTFAIPMENVFDEHGVLSVANPPKEGVDEDSDDVTILQRIFQIIGGLIPW